MIQVGCFFHEKGEVTLYAPERDRALYPPLPAHHVAGSAVRLGDGEVVSMTMTPMPDGRGFEVPTQVQQLEFHGFACSPASARRLFLRFEDAMCTLESVVEKLGGAADETNVAGTSGTTAAWPAFVSMMVAAARVRGMSSDRKLGGAFEAGFAHGPKLRLWILVGYPTVAGLELPDNAFRVDQAANACEWAARALGLRARVVTGTPRQIPPLGRDEHVLIVLLLGTLGLFPDKHGRGLTNLDSEPNVWVTPQRHVPLLEALGLTTTHVFWPGWAPDAKLAILAFAEAMEKSCAFLLDAHGGQRKWCNEVGGEGCAGYLEEVDRMTFTRRYGPKATAPATDQLLYVPQTLLHQVTNFNSKWVPTLRQPTWMAKGHQQFTATVFLREDLNDE